MAGSFIWIKVFINLGQSVVINMLKEIHKAKKGKSFVSTNNAQVRFVVLGIVSIREFMEIMTYGHAVQYQTLGKEQQAQELLDLMHH